MQLCSMNFLAASMFHSNRLTAATRNKAKRRKTKARHSLLNTGPSVLLVIDQGVIPYETVAAVNRTARQLSHGGTTSIIGTVR